MGCSQSNDAADPLQKNPSNSPNKATVPQYTNTHHEPEEFLITMIGNTTTNGLVLGFTHEAFIPIACRIGIPRYCNALLESLTTGYITGGIE